MVNLDFTDPATIGWTFVVLGVVLLLLEASAPGFFLGVPATVLLILGVLAFVAPEVALSPTYAPIIVVVIGLPATVGTILMYRRLAPPEVSATTTTGDTLLGAVGEVVRQVEPGTSRGKVRIQRQVWSCTADRAIPEGAAVRVVDANGVILTVAPVESG